MASSHNSDTGVATQEGIKAGDFAAKLSRQREEKEDEFARRLREIDERRRKPIVRDDKFISVEKSVDYEAELKARTVGLVTMEEYKKAAEEVAAKTASTAARGAAGIKETAPGAPATSSIAAAETKRKRAMLSFADDEDDDRPSVIPRARTAAAATSSADAEVAPQKRPRITKDPTVDTHFLPDAERDRQEAELREKLRLEWLEEQERIKTEKIEVVYSWWDGTGHRRTIAVPKGTSIYRFLEWAKQDLMADFPVLKGTSTDNLMYVKEDCIIPQSLTFYDLIVSKAKGKSGQLFTYSSKSDGRAELDEGRPGKIVERRWYEKNKHLFPASRWELFDMATHVQGGISK